MLISNFGNHWEGGNLFWLLELILSFTFLKMVPEETKLLIQYTAKLEH